LETKEFIVAKEITFTFKKIRDHDYSTYNRDIALAQVSFEGTILKKPKKTAEEKKAEEELIKKRDE